MSKNEIRINLRMTLEQIIIDYYNACQECDYPFESDIKDIIFDATGIIMDC